MTDPRLKKLADILVNYCVEVKPRDWVFIRSSIIAEPLLNEVVERVMAAGGHVSTEIFSDRLDEIFFKTANQDQLKWVPPFRKLAYEQADVMIYLDAADNTRALNGVDPAKQQLYKQTTGPLLETHIRRAAEKSWRWALTSFPCHAFAQDADMSLTEYEDFVYSATYADTDNPVAEWQRIHDEQQRIVDWLKGKKIVAVKSPNADLTLSVEGRTFINSDGKENMPSGEVFTSPVEDSANGWVHFTYPAIDSGREVKGVRLEFKDGKVVKASAEKNEEFLLSQLDSDEGARYLGEFAIGTNYGITKFTKNILFDEKIGGSFHIAIGAGFPETGGKNTSGVHWDFICDIRQDSEIHVDGELLYKDGQFKI